MSGAKSDERPTIADVRTAVQRFTESPDFPQTFLLTGAWGVGKTHLWRQILADAVRTKRCARPKYSYCSLFGLESVALVRDKIFSGLTDTVASRPTGPETVEDVFKNFAGVNDALGRVSEGARALAAKGSGLLVRWGLRRAPEWAMRFPALAAYEPLVRAATFAFVKDAIICIDDLERRSAQLSLRDVLGFVSFLREERRCKVIVIANEDTLDEDDKETLRELREKVFEIVVTLDPPNDYAQEIAIPADAAFRDEWMNRASYLDLTNIRILRRIVALHKQLEPLLEGAPETARRNCISSLLLIGTRHFQHDAELPPMDLIFQTGAFRIVTEDGPKNERKRWSEFLTDYGWYSPDELDYTLLQFVESGCINEMKVRQFVELSRRRHEEEKRHEELSSPWAMFRGSFDDNEAELVKAFIDTHTEHSLYLSPMNLDSAVRRLRDLGASAEADKLINHYIESRKDDKDVLDLEKYAFWREVRDERLIAAFQARFKAIPINKDLPEVLLRMERTQGWGISDSEFLRTITVDQFEEAFRKASGDDLGAMIKSALHYGGPTAEDRAVSANATEALVRIGKTSRLNRARVLRHGVSIPEGGDEAGHG